MRVCSSAMSKWNECCGLHRSSISYRKIRWTYPWSFVLYSTYNGHVLKIYLQSYNLYWICEWSKLNHSFWSTIKKCCVNSSNSPDKMLIRELGLHWKKTYFNEIQSFLYWIPRGKVYQAFSEWMTWLFIQLTIVSHFP